MVTAINSGVLRIIPVLIAACFISISAHAQYGGGTGEPNDPYLIYTTEHLNNLSAEPNDWDKHFKLMADIDLSGNSYDAALIAPDVDPCDPSFKGTSFTGVFDGNDHIISHLTIKGEDYLGLFGYSEIGAKIRNLGLLDVNITGSGNFIGGLLGDNAGSVTNCYNTGVVSGDYYVGGLVGHNDNGSNIVMSYSTSAVRGKYNVGGLLGDNTGSVTNCYSTSTVSGNDSVGGLVGYNRYGGYIVTNYSTKIVMGMEGVGGLVGSNFGSIATSYSTSEVNGERLVGGLVGDNGWHGSIVMSYSTGTISGEDNVGGLVGSNTGSITSSFWVMETSGQATSAGGIGITTAEIHDIDTLLSEGWDFVNEVLNGTCDYWQMSSGNYPQLRYQVDNNLVMPEGCGTAQEPYLIQDVRDLGTVWFKPLAHYRLEASIDLSEITWSVAIIPCFGGIFEGNGYVISNLHIQGSGYIGLFGQLSSGAKISNLGIEAVDVDGKGDIVGGFVGFNWGSINTSYSTGIVSGQWGVGGLVGVNWRDASINSSYSSGTVIGKYSVGGLVGDNGLGGSTTLSYSTGTVTGYSYVGGLVGGNWGYASVDTSYSTGMVTGDRSVGGLVGDNGLDGSIVTSYSTGVVSGEDNVGGLVGSNTGNITSSFWDIESSGQSSSAGGIGKTTAQMKDIQTFLDAGWDFETLWMMPAGDYPRLEWKEWETPDSGDWARLSSMKMARDQFAGGVIGDEIFVFGGNAMDGTDLYSGEKYNIATDTWSDIADNPHPRESERGWGVEELSGIGFNGRFYVFGARGRYNDEGSFGNFNYNEMYDPTTNTWTTLAKKPTTTVAAIPVVYEGKIYLFGGSVSDEEPREHLCTKVEAYDPEHDEWEYVTEIPKRLDTGKAIAVHGNCAYLIGGYDHDTGAGNYEVMAYDFKTGGWIRDYCTLPKDAAWWYSYATQAPAVNDKVYLIGGAEGEYPENYWTSDKFTIFDIESKSWESGPTLPQPRDDPLTVVANNTIYVIGGDDGVNAKDTVFSFRLPGSPDL